MAVRCPDMAEEVGSIPTSRTGVIMGKEIIRNASIKLGKGWVGTCITCPHCGEYVWLKVEQEEEKAKVKK